MPQLYDHCSVCGKEKTTYQQRTRSVCAACSRQRQKDNARKGYEFCVDCGEPKTTYSQQLSPRCNACAGIKKRADKGEYYTHCIDCGAEKPLGTSRRSPCCRQCAYDMLRKNEYLDMCQECGKQKGLSKSRICRSCANKKRAKPKAVKVVSEKSVALRYSKCQNCGCKKARTTSHLCKSCSLKATWDKKGRVRTLYDICQECGEDKPRNDRHLCLSCAGIKRMIGQFGTEDKEYPMGWCDTLKERIRDRDGHKCQLCGKTRKENGRKLDVHHIDEDKHNLEPSNLVALCASCHGKTKWRQDFYYQVFTKYRGRVPKQDWQHRMVVTA